MKETIERAIYSFLKLKLPVPVDTGVSRGRANPGHEMILSLKRDCLPDDSLFLASRLPGYLPMSHRLLGLDSCRTAARGRGCHSSQDNLRHRIASMS
jgi:hypothetical protein